MSRAPASERTTSKKKTNVATEAASAPSENSARARSPRSNEVRERNQSRERQDNALIFFDAERGYEKCRRRAEAARVHRPQEPQRYRRRESVFVEIRKRRADQRRIERRHDDHAERKRLGHALARDQKDRRQREPAGRRLDRRQRERRVREQQERRAQIDDRRKVEGEVAAAFTRVAEAAKYRRDTLREQSEIRTRAVSRVAIDAEPEQDESIGGTHEPHAAQRRHSR
jgi:hypothetical protein